MLHFTPVLAINTIVVGLVTIAGFLFGGWREKVGVSVMSGTLILTFVLRALFPQSDSVWRYVISDEIYLIGIVALIWKSPHPWPVWVAMLQLVAVALDINALLNREVTRYFLYTMLYVVAYGQKIAFVVGIFAAWRRRRSARLNS